MKQFFRLSLCTLGFLLGSVVGAAEVPATTVQAGAAANSTAATVATGKATARTPDLLEHMVDVILDLFNVKSSGNTVSHYVIAHAGAMRHAQTLDATG